MNKIASIVSVLIILIIYGCGGGDSTHEKHPKLLLESVLAEFKSCKDTSQNKHGCKTYIGKAINGNFEIPDFNHPEKKGEYIDYDQVADMVKTSNRWKNIGSATDQDALDYFQKCSNEGIPALAISTQSGNGNVAIGVPGKQIKSTSWALNCPTIAIFFPNRPEQSFIGKTLNYGWSKPDGIELYIRD